MPTHEKHDTHQKALSLNLDITIFGSFAEIGAGQEVARWFLRVGGASGTVAKTISAYDKEVSDHLYGMGTRYVSKPRLLAMLNSEWEQLLGQLQASRGTDTKFFSFVDTISARNYAGTNDCHGWVGLRFRTQPNAAPNDVILHVNLRDSSNVQQQEAVGILGVNLIYAAYHAAGSVEEFLASAFEDLGLQRVEIDCVESKGPAFESWDRNQLHASGGRRIRGSGGLPRKQPIRPAQRTALQTSAGFGSWPVRQRESASCESGPGHPGPIAGGRCRRE
jgi:hypothetical protein